MSERFRILVSGSDEDGWEATVYDLHDHGPDLPYAGISAGSIAQVLDAASHYVLVASADDPAPTGDIAT